MRMRIHGALYAVNPEYDPNRTTWDATPLEARLQVNYEPKPLYETDFLARTLKLPSLLLPRHVWRPQS